MENTELPTHRHIEGTFTYCFEKPKGQRIVLKIPRADGSTTEILLPSSLDPKLLDLDIAQAKVIQGSCSDDRREEVSEESPSENQFEVLLSAQSEQDVPLELLDKLGEEGVPPLFPAKTLYGLFELLEFQNAPESKLLSLAIALVKHCDPQSLKRSIMMLLVWECRDKKRRDELHQCAIKNGFCTKAELSQIVELEEAKEAFDKFKKAYNRGGYEEALPHLKKMLGCEGFRLNNESWAAMWTCLEQIKTNVVMARDVLISALEKLPEDQIDQAQATVLSLSQRLGRLSSEHRAECLCLYPGTRDKTFLREAAGVANALYHKKQAAALSRLLQAVPDLLGEESLDCAVLHAQLIQHDPGEALPLLERLAERGEMPEIARLIDCLKKVLISQDAKRGWAVLEALGKHGLRLKPQEAAPIMKFLEKSQPGQRADQLRILRSVSEVGASRCWRLLKQEPIDTLNAKVLLQMPPAPRKQRGLQRRAVEQCNKSSWKRLKSHFGDSSRTTRRIGPAQVLQAINKREYDRAFQDFIKLQSVPKKERAEMHGAVTKFLEHLMLEENGLERCRKCYVKSAKLGVLPRSLSPFVLQYWLQEEAIDLLKDARKRRLWDLKAYLKTQTNAPALTEPMAVQYWIQFWKALPKLAEPADELETCLNQIHFPRAGGLGPQVSSVDPLCEALLDLFESQPNGWANEARKRFVEFLALSPDCLEAPGTFALFQDPAKLRRVARLPQTIAPCDLQTTCHSLALLAHCLDSPRCTQPMELHRTASKMFAALATSEESIKKRETLSRIGWERLQNALHWQNIQSAEKASAGLTLLSLKLQLSNASMEERTENRSEHFLALFRSWSVIVENGAITQMRKPFWETTAALLESLARYGDQDDLGFMETMLRILNEKGLVSDLSPESQRQMGAVITTLCERKTKCLPVTALNLASSIVALFAPPSGLKRVELSFLKAVQRRVEGHANSVWSELIDSTAGNKDPVFAYEAVTLIDSMRLLMGLKDEETISYLVDYLNKVAGQGDGENCAVALGCCARRGLTLENIPLKLEPSYNTIVNLLANAPRVSVPEDDPALDLILLSALREGVRTPTIEGLGKHLKRVEGRETATSSLALLDMRLSIARKLIFSGQSDQLLRGWKFLKRLIDNSTEELFERRGHAFAQLTLAALEQSIMHIPDSAPLISHEILKCFGDRRLDRHSFNIAWYRIFRWFDQSLTLAAHESGVTGAQTHYLIAWMGLDALLTSTALDDGQRLMCLHEWCVQAAVLGPHDAEPLLPVMSKMVQSHSHLLPGLFKLAATRIPRLNSETVVRQVRFYRFQTLLTLLLHNKQMTDDLGKKLFQTWVRALQAQPELQSLVSNVVDDPNYKKYLQ